MNHQLLVVLTPTRSIPLTFTQLNLERFVELTAETQAHT